LQYADRQAVVIEMNVSGDNPGVAELHDFIVAARNSEFLG
jgi:hypothetical protein